MYKPAAPPAYNPPGGTTRAGSPANIDAERSTDDVLAELFGLPTINQAHQVDINILVTGLPRQYAQVHNGLLSQWCDRCCAATSL